ncbi:MAG: hypothetical protein C0483_05645 [Pirellula sp.]|nr:hypothetical protein [Pirellula sp.]
MAGVHGEQMYGKVDHVPGLFYVSTMFWHINFVPIIPLRSYVVLEAAAGNEQFQGKPIGWNAKSVLVGYLRGWSAAVGIIAMVVAGVAGGGFFVPRGEAPLAVAVFLALCGAWYAAIYKTPGTRFVVVQSLLLIIGAVLIGWELSVLRPNGLGGEMFKKLQHVLQALLATDLAMLLYLLSRLITPAGYDRAVVLAGEIGMERDDFDAHWQQAA